MPIISQLELGTWIKKKKMALIEIKTVDRTVDIT